MKGAKYTKKLYAWRYVDLFVPGDKVPDGYYPKEQVERMIAGQVLCYGPPANPPDKLRYMPRDI
jgi:hypothetical protein